MATQPQEAHQSLPAAASGLRRALNRAGLVLLHVIPGPLRRRLGWWRWDEVLEGCTYGDYLHVTQNQEGGHPGPVALLHRRGIRLSPKINPWPHEFEDFHKTWNWENKWGTLPKAELAAWAAVWKTHPLGQESLDTALVGVAQHGNIEAVKVLLVAGANPHPVTEFINGGSLMRQLWGASMPFKHRLEIWKIFSAASDNTTCWQTWTENDPVARRYNARQLTRWQKSGTLMPTGASALLLALAWVDDPAVSDSHDEGFQVAIAAVRWWKKNGNLPADANTQLLQKWLSSARPGDEEHYQKAVIAWSQELLSDGLPPRPAIGPRWSHMSHVPDDGPQPWSHWVLNCPFFENLPQPFLEQLCAEPDAWTAVNQDGHTMSDLLDTGIESIRSQSRDEGRARIKAWAAAHRLEQVLEQVLNHPSLPAPSAPRPRF